MQLSPLLARAGFRHAFFTRRGGVSEKPFESLNFSISVGDRPDRVRENLRLAAEVLEVVPNQVHFLDQVHGADIHEISTATALNIVQATPGDALMSRDRHLACGVRVADCVPLLLAHPDSGAVAAVHSGWRGCLANIAGVSVKALRKLGGPTGPILAAVGPHIQGCCFEVSDDIARQLAGASSATNVILPGKGVRPHVDMRAIIHAQLRAAGVDESDIDHVSGCTFCTPADYFSYRRDGARSGRMLCAIAASSA